MIIDELFEAPQLCPECGGISFSDLILAEKKDACYHKVKASAKVWPSAYASGRLVQCRKKGAANYGNKSEGVAEGPESKKFKVTYELQNGDVKEKIMIGKDANAVAKYFEFKYRHKPISVVEQGVAEGQENFNGIDISMEIQKDDEYVDDEDYDNQVIYVTASSKGKELGHVLFAFDGEYLMPQDLEVEERYRGQGIAQTMYDYVKSKGYKIRRSGQQTDAGTGFWDKHKPGKNVWEQGVAEGLWDQHTSIPELEQAIKNLIMGYKGGVNLTDKGRAQLLLSINKGKRILAKKKQQQDMAEGRMVKGPSGSSYRCQSKTTRNAQVACDS
jgi:GNAT superfamily N-acetyltransferase